MSEEEGNYQVRESAERTAIPPFVAPTGYIPSALQPSQSSGLAGSSIGSSKRDDCGAAPVCWRTWAMPSHNTFDVPPIGGFVQKYLLRSQVSVDPFARNKRWATHTNDLNPGTNAEHHMEALDFLAMLEAKGVLADLVIFDPPYSARQIQECYSQVGRKVTMQDTQGKSWSDWKSAIARICTPDATVLCFGWNTNGMGIKHGFEIAEIMMVAHGGVHNDTICMAEIRRAQDDELFPRELMQREEGSLCAA